MADLLLEPLPTACMGLPIDPDFRPMVWLANAYARGEPDKQPVYFAAEQLDRFYRVPISSDQLSEAYHAMLEFYLGGSEELGSGREGPSRDEVALDYHCDAPYIIAAFQQVYGIDLTTAHLHWWRFKALLCALPEDCLLARIIHWRTADLSDLPPTEKAFYTMQRERFALPPEVKGGAARAVSVAEHDRAFIARFRT